MDNILWYSSQKKQQKSFESSSEMVIFRLCGARIRNKNVVYESNCKLVRRENITESEIQSNRSNTDAFCGIIIVVS